MSLHLVSCSSWHSSALQNCLLVLQPNDVLLLLGDGIFCLSNPNVPLPENSYVLTDDLHLRIGDPEIVAKLHHRPRAISMEQWVEFAVSHQNSVSWF